MHLFRKRPDGGAKSPVQAYFLIENKRLFSVAILRFNEGGRAAYHTHAFKAWTWFLWGDLVETRRYSLHDVFWLRRRRYRRSILPKITDRDNNHRVFAYRTSWCFTIRGPWSETWTEDQDGVTTTFGHGREVIRQVRQTFFQWS